MRAVTIKKAKARLNELVEAVCKGEQVVLLRGSEHVAAIVPITADDLELNLSITDAQAEKLWRKLENERRSGQVRTFETAEQLLLQVGDSATGRRLERRRKARSRRATHRRK